MIQVNVLQSIVQSSCSNTIKNFGDAVKKATPPTSYVVAHKIVEFAKVEHPTWKTKTGQVDKSWSVDRGDPFAFIINKAKHSIFLLNGTKPHPIVAKNAPYLHFFWAKKGHWVTTKRVMHPGTKGEDWIGNAYNNHQKEIDDLGQRTMIIEVQNDFSN